MFHQKDMTIIEMLEEERDKLDRAIAALSRGIGKRPYSRRSSKTGRRKRRTMSAAAKKRIGEAMKKRWAERKRATKAA